MFIFLTFLLIVLRVCTLFVMRFNVSVIIFSVIFFSFVCIEVQRPSQQFSVISERKYRFLDINKYSGELTCLTEGQSY